MSKKYLLILIAVLLISCNSKSIVETNETEQNDASSIGKEQDAESEIVVLVDAKDHKPVTSYVIGSKKSDEAQSTRADATSQEANETSAKVTESNNTENKATKEASTENSNESEENNMQNEIAANSAYTDKDKMMDQHWDVSEKYTYDETGLLHIKPFIKNNIEINDDVIRNYNEDLELFNKILDDMSNGKEYSELTDEENAVYGEYERGTTPWFVGEFCGWYCVNGFKEALASSTLYSENDKYDVKNITNEYIDSCWAEGVEGDGIGESFTLKSVTPRIPRLIALYNGYSKSEDTYFNNNRIKELKLYVNDNLVALLHLEDTMDEQVFVLERLEATEHDFEFRFEIVSVYKGGLYDDTCLSAIQILDGH